MYQIHQQAWQPLDLRKILNEIEKLRRIEISGLRNIAVFKLLLICLNVEESGGETSRWLNAKFQLNQVSS